MVTLAMTKLNANHDGNSSFLGRMLAFMLTKVHQNIIALLTALLPVV
jgi:hypothetical protein